jgi:four helix bundle protein
VQDYRKLKVWQKAHKLRAAISVPSNIAEGAGRGSDPDFRRFLLHSLGSLNEVEYDLLLARDLGFLPSVEHARFSASLEEVRRMLSGLIASIEDSTNPAGEFQPES